VKCVIWCKCTNISECSATSVLKVNEHCNINKFTIFHQNIRAISNKIYKFLNSASPNAPQDIYLTEQHLRNEEIRNVNFSQYTLGASFCRQTYSHGCVCVFVPKNIHFHIINLDQYNKEKDFETCAWSYTYYQRTSLYSVFIDVQLAISLLFKIN